MPDLWWAAFDDPALNFYVNQCSVRISRLLSPYRGCAPPELSRDAKPRICFPTSTAS